MERKYLRIGIISSMACLLGVFFLFVGGCSDQEEPPQQTAKMVRKKIAVPSGAGTEPSSPGLSEKDASDGDSKVIRKKIAMPSANDKSPAEDLGPASPVPEESPEKTLAKAELPEVTSAPASEERKFQEDASPEEDTPPSAEQVKTQTPSEASPQESEKEKEEIVQTDKAARTAKKDDTPSDSGEPLSPAPSDKQKSKPQSPETASADSEIGQDVKPEKEKPSEDSSQKAEEEKTAKTVPQPSSPEKPLPDVKPSPRKSEKEKTVLADGKKDDAMSDLKSEPLEKKDKSLEDTGKILAKKQSDQKLTPKTTPGESPKKDISDTREVISDGTGGLMASLGIGKKKEEEESEKREIYNPSGKVDPFAPLFREETGTARPEPESAPQDTEDAAGAKKSGRQKRLHQGPLEKVDLSQLKLVGIIRAESGNKAMVEEASGKGYIINRGTYIGINSGKVAEILRDRVIVEEEGEDPSGEMVIRKRELKLQKPLGEDYYEM